MAGLRQHTLDLTPLRASRDYRLLMTGGAVSAIGSGLTRVAVPLQVYELTKSSWKVGLAGAISLVPVLSASIVGGALADVADKRKVVLASLCSGAVLTALLALHATTQPRLAVLYILGMLVGVNGAFASPANRSAAPVLLPASMLPAAQALSTVSYTAAGVLAPAVAGLLFTSVGATWLYALDAVSYAACFLAVIRMRPIPPGGAAGDRVTPTLIADGFRSLRGMHAVQGSFLADLIAMVFGMPTALFPALAAVRFADHPRLVGLLYAALPFGTMASGLFSGWTRTAHRYGYILVASIVVWGVAIAGLGIVHGITVTVMCLVVAGAADGVSGVARIAMLQMSTPPHLQGRMQGVGMAVWIGGPYLGDAEAGGVAALAGVDTSIVIGGVACIAAIVLLTLVRPAFARFDARPARPAS